MSTLLLADDSVLVAWRGRAGPDEVLRVARITPDGVIRGRTAVHQSHFPRWPSRHISLAQLGEQVFVAWTDAAAKRVRLTAIALEGKPAKR